MEVTSAAVFLKLCQDNSYKQVQEHLSQGFNVNLEDSEGTTGLQVTCAYGHEQLTEFLLTNGVDPDKCNTLGVTPLMHAVGNDNYSIVTILLKHHVNVNQNNRYGMNALLMATARGNTKIVKLLVNNGAVSSSGHSGVTPLMIASLFQQQHLVGYYKHQGVDVNKVTDKGLTALMMAANTGQKSMVKALLDRGADPNIVNCRQETAMDVAMATSNSNDCNTTISDYINKKSKNKLTEVSQNEILQAVVKGDYVKVTQCLKIDWLFCNTVRKEDDATPVMLASISGDFNMISILCHYGANTDMQDKQGWTALMWAVLNCHEECCRVLLKYCDPGIRNKDGLTAADIIFISGNGDSSIEKLFLELLIKSESALSNPRLEPDNSKSQLGTTKKWFRVPRRKQKTVSNPGKPAIIKKGNIVQNRIPVYLHQCRHMPTMNSMNYKLRGNDIKPLDPQNLHKCQDKPINEKPASEDTDEQSDIESLNSLLQASNISSTILTNYSISPEDKVVTILKKVGLQQYVKAFEDEMVEKEDFLELDVEDLNLLGIKDSFHIIKLMSIIRALPKI